MVAPKMHLGIITPAHYALPAELAKFNTDKQAGLKQCQPNAVEITAALSELLQLNITRLVIVTGTNNPDAFAALVVSRLMILERLDIEVALIFSQHTVASSRFKLPIGARAIQLALHGTAQPTVLTRDDTATVLLGKAIQQGRGGADFIGESYVDSELLFTDKTRRVEIIPSALPAITDAPGVHARISKRRFISKKNGPGKLFSGGWITGRAIQTGGIDILVTRDELASDRGLKRSTFYRHHIDWLLVRS